MPSLLAPAKINATLEILGRREDGYHNLRSVMLPIALYDRIELEPGSGFVATDPALAENNLVARALAAAGLADRVSAVLHKTIPVGGGLGGGSSDAAAVLAAAMRGDFGPCETRDWLDAARRIGSDVPFFLVDTGAIVEGAGERVTAIGALPPWWVVVVRPHVAVPTAVAYRMLAEARASGADRPGTRPRGESVSLRAVDALQRHDFAAFEDSLQNDFHAPVLAAYPEVAASAAAMTAAGATRVLLSGSGSCLFAAFESEAEARVLDAALAGRGDVIAEHFAVALHHGATWR